MNEPITPESALLSSRRDRAIFWGLVIAAAIVGIQHAVSIWYINDDCYVSFRYAKNLVNGLGLVYNAGERVEGFTNFSWTMLIALGMKLGIDPVNFSTSLGIVFHGATILLCGLLSWRFRLSGRGIVLPLSSIALSVHRDFNAHATSGMETGMFAFLVSAGFAALLLRPEGRHLGAGFIFVVAMMTRPDGVIFLAASCVYLVLINGVRDGNLVRSARALAGFLLPVVVVFVPYWVWRSGYYGFFFPNTFYAKSIALPYYSEGFFYALLYFKTYYVFGLGLLAAGVGLAIKGKASFRGAGGDPPPRTRALLLCALFVASYTAFVIRIGGDFMFARFFIAVTPMIFLGIEILLAEAFGNSPLVAGLLIAAVILRYDQYGKDLLVGYVADEPRYFTREALRRAQMDGATLRKYFDDLPVRVSFWAGQLKLIYYADPYYAIESSGGLTDTAVAHQSIANRGRPGHEKTPTTEYLIRRNVQFYIGPLPPPPPGHTVINAIVFENILGRILVYDDSIMNRLARHPEVRFVNMPAYLDSYLASMDTMPREKVESDFLYFQSYYLKPNRDTSRWLRFTEFLKN